MEDLYNRTNSIRRQPIIYTQTETSNKNINLNNNYNQLNYINGQIIIMNKILMIK